MRWILVLLSILLSITPARANDSTAELATGGLVLTKTDAIEMRSEELFISAKEIRVRYRFFDIGGSDVTTLVAFPMPDITVSGPTDNIAVPTEQPENLLGFRTVVNGKPVQAKVEQKALVGDADHTALLQRLGIPLAPHLRSANRALDRLPREQWDELVKLGLAASEQYDVGQGMQDHLEARWTLKTTYYWQQTFPAGRELAVEHAYQPSVGASVQSSLGEPDATKEDWYADYQRKYCMDEALLTAVARARKAARSSHGSPFSEERIAYILKTGANWAGPIKDFRLVVDKGDPSSLVSFCAEGVKKISATRFEMRKRDFTPENDVFVLILKRLPADR